METLTLLDQHARHLGLLVARHELDPTTAGEWLSEEEVSQTDNVIHEGEEHEQEN